MTQVAEIDYHVLTALTGHQQPVTVRDLAAELGLDQAKVSAVCLTRAGQEIELTEEKLTELRLGKKAADMAEGFPERRIAAALNKAGGQAELPDLPEMTGLQKKEVGQSLRWLKQKGWAEQNGRSLTLTADGKAALAQEGEDEKLLQKLQSNGPLTSNASLDFCLDTALKQLEGRNGVVDLKERTIRRVQLTAAGRNLVEQGISFRQTVTQLTPELLRDGGWKEVDFRPYDVSLSSQAQWSAKEHPLVSVFQQTRKVFLELGFEETVSGYVESSFWDFDALFQPQDHPARDMQDTFYVGRPARCRLPDEKLVKEVGSTHVDGGSTGSVGWRYDWDRGLAEKPVLRTHTTASTIRALAADPNPPRKVFCVGPVFRRETVDYKHLPVFHQVDGIIIDEKGSFASLLGTLQAFYKKMGFKKFQFRPAFFPYTEPSVEIFVWSENKKDWVEMGGAGMFRPEVTEPLGCSSPVLAWGLGLERLAMFRYELNSIGELYRARMQWLKETPLCR